jgi:hypothetical protein
MRPPRMTMNKKRVTGAIAALVLLVSGGGLAYATGGCGLLGFVVFRHESASTQQAVAR